MFMHANLRVNKTVTVGTNLYCLLYSTVIDIVFPKGFALS